MSQFFISYAREDERFALELRRNIARIDNAHKIFLDQFNLDIGSPMDKTITKRIQECDYFLIILSKQSSQSEWVTKELKIAQSSELQTGEKKIFAIQLDHAALPDTLLNYLVLDLADQDNFVPGFFKLMNSIYQRPTHYEIAHRAYNDPEQGYLFDIWIECSVQYKKLIDFVEYRFDYEFGNPGWNSDKLDGAVHQQKNRRNKFCINELWTSESITVFVVIYLKNTKALYFIKHIRVGDPANP